MQRHYPSQPLIGVGAIIMNRNKMLIVKRANEPAKGLWSVPGGVVELGEQLHEALKREVKEETGLEVSEPRLVDVVNYIRFGEKDGVKYHYVIIDYIVTSKGGKVNAASDADDLKWVPFQEVEKYNLTESFRRFFQRNRQKLENSSLLSEE